MYSHIKIFCQSCMSCQLFNAPKTPLGGELQKMNIQCKFKVVAMDLVHGLTQSAMGNKVILTITDLATRFVVAIPLTDGTAV